MKRYRLSRLDIISAGNEMTMTMESSMELDSSRIMNNSSQSIAIGEKSVVSKKHEQLRSMLNEKLRKVQQEHRQSASFDLLSTSGLRDKSIFESGDGKNGFNVSKDKYLVLVKGKKTKVFLKKNEYVRGHVDTFKQSLPLRIRFKREFSKADFYVEFGKFPTPSEYSLCQVDSHQIVVGRGYSSALTTHTGLRFVVRSRDTCLNQIAVEFFQEGIPSRIVLKSTERSMELDNVKRFGINYREFLQISLKKPSFDFPQNNKRSMVISPNSSRADSQQMHLRNISNLQSFTPQELRKKMISLKQLREERSSRAKNVRSQLLEKEEAERLEQVKKFEERRAVERLIVDMLLKKAIKKGFQFAWVRTIKSLLSMQHVYIKLKMAVRLAAWRQSVSLHRRIVDIIRPKVRAWKESKASDPVSISLMSLNFFAGLKSFDVKTRSYEAARRFLLEVVRVKSLNFCMFSTITKYTMFQNRWRNHIRRRDAFIEFFKRGFIEGVRLMRIKGVFTLKQIDSVDDYINGPKGNTLFRMIFNLKLRSYLIRKVAQIIERDDEKLQEKERINALYQRKKEKTLLEQINEQLEEKSRGQVAVEEPSMCLEDIKHFELLKNLIEEDEESKIFQLIEMKMLENPEKNLSRWVFGKAAASKNRSSVNVVMTDNTIHHRLQELNNFKQIKGKLSDADLLEIPYDAVACIDLAYHLVAYLTQDTK